MKKKKFFEICNRIQKFNLDVEKTGLFSATVLEVSESLSFVVDELFREILTKEGFEWVNWFMYEKGYADNKLRDDLKAWDEDEKEIVKNLVELYEYLKKNKYFKTKKK